MLLARYWCGFAGTLYINKVWSDRGFFVFALTEKICLICAIWVKKILVVLFVVAAEKKPVGMWLTVYGYPYIHGH